MGRPASALRQSPSELDLVRFDTALTVSAMRYIRAVHTGRVNPKEFKFELDVDNNRLQLSDFFRNQLVNAGDPAAVIQKVEPSFPGYLRLLAALPRFMLVAQQDNGEKLPAVTKAVAPGQTYAGVPRLATMLKLFGDLPTDAQIPADSLVYEGPLVDAVKHYQSRHGEEINGRLDTHTIDELNTPLSYRLRQIQLTLERWRWLSHSFSSSPIIVNLPEFRLRAMAPDGNVALYKTVIVGKAYGHKSPVFEKEMKYVVFRPYWEVAPSIERNEIVPHIAKDRSYLAKNRFEIITPDGQLVTDSEVSDDVLAQLKAGKLHIRQKPGPKNSLGLVKLIFPTVTTSTCTAPTNRHCFRKQCVISAMGAFAWKIPRT